MWSYQERRIKLKSKVYQNWESVPQILTVEQAANLLQMDTQTVRRLSREGNMPGAIKVGKFWRFDKNKIMQYAGVA
jgi:excisionase family DNA binding protein